MNANTSFQDYMAGWDEAIAVLSQVGITHASSILKSVCCKDPYDPTVDFTMGLRECCRTALELQSVPMAAIEIFS